MFGAAGHLPELIIILVIGLLILGPGKLPQLGSSVGKTIREFRKGVTDTEEEAAAKASAEAQQVAQATPKVEDK